MQYLRSALGPVPQSEPLPGQVPNSAGGHSYGLDDWARLDRFLILGSEGGSYYASERKLTRDNCQAVERCIAADGQEVVRRVVAVSDAGRAPKNDPAILALALALKNGDLDTRRAAAAAVPKVCRIGTHLLHLAAFVNDLGGWGRGTKRAFAKWYTDKSPTDLGHQLVKYQSRDGWSNRDILRLAHPVAPGVDHAALFAWATGKPDVDLTTLPAQVLAFERFKEAAESPPTPAALAVIRDLNMPREAIPTQWLNERGVWEAMLPRMGLTALIRNLATMTRIGLLDPTGSAAELVAERITDGEALRKSRVHPLAILTALKTYQAGRGLKSAHTWTPVRKVVDALDAAFYASFGNVEATGKRTILALDVSGSMHSGSVGGVQGLTPAVCAAAMAMVTMAVEKRAEVYGFGGHYAPLDISPRRRLDDIVAYTRRMNFGTTDCALPIVHAAKSSQAIDFFAVYTDSETYMGHIHPSAALKAYRKQVPGAKLAVVGMVSNGFTIADPQDLGMLDVVGFDTATPNVLSEFARS